MKKELFSGTFFLIISILVTLSAVASLMDGMLNVFPILYAIACWLVYGSVKSGAEHINGLGFGCGTTKALFIVNWVFIGILTAFGLMVMFSGWAIMNAIMHWGSLGYGYGFSYNYGYSGGYGSLSSLLRLFERFGSVGFVWFGLTVLVCAAAAAAVNLLFVRNLLTFFHSLKSSFESGAWHVEKAESVYKWLFVLGILSSLGILSLLRDGLAATVSAAGGAAMIVASRWIKHDIIPAVPSGDYGQQSGWYSSEQ